MASFLPLAATGIGSVPFTEPDETVGLIVTHMPHIPYWPQMVRRGFLEEMVAQAARNLPGLKIDQEARVVMVDPGIPRDEALAHFYEMVFAGDLELFAFMPEEASGFFALLKAAAACPQCRALKGQLAGPVTFCGMVKDPQGKPILYDRELTQAMGQGLALKAAWQAAKFRETGKDAVVFLDEPYLTGFGSAFMTVSREEVQEILTHALEAIRQSGPVALGVHCCGNTDWAMLLETPIDILSFDSYGYFDNLKLYAKTLARFFERDGILAWGLVPTGEDLKHETTDGLWRRFQEQVEDLAGALNMEVKEVLSRAWLTPACGMGYLTPDLARQALAVLSDLSARGREWLAKL
jgi:methionine synthase II (cobalamin-independent)